jgi:hypothetical protein
MTGAERIAAERQRQIQKEGWTSENDDRYKNGELLRAAICYLNNDPTGWPWDPSWWKPSTPIRNLEKAGALIAAEIDRKQRSLV